MHLSTYIPNKTILLATAILLASPLFFVGVGNNPACFASQLYAPGHFIFFALLTWLLCLVPVLSRLTFARQAALIILLVLIIGGSIELIQPFFGRTASWKDIGINIGGALAGLFFLSPSRTGLDRILLTGFQALALGLCIFIFYGPVITLWDMYQASRQFPMLSDFENRLQHKRWSNGRIDQSVSRQGDSSLRVNLDAGQQYPGTTLTHSFGDWRGYSALSLSIYNPDPDPLRINISIRDQEHRMNRRGFGDRFDRTFEIIQGWNDLLIPMTDIKNAPKERTLDLDQLTSVVIFTMNLSRPRTIYVDNVRLNR